MAAHRENKGGRPWVTTAWITVTALILLAPLVAMQSTDELNWTVSDFAFMGALLVGAGLIYELAAWKIRDPRYRAAVGAALVVVVLAIWVEGAVGIFH